MTVKVYVVEGYQNHKVNRGSISIHWKGAQPSKAQVSNGVAEFAGNGGPFDSITWYDKVVYGAGNINDKTPVSVNIG